MTNAEALLAARRDPASRPAALPEPPRDAAAAYALQAEIQARLGPVGGWKVGSPNPTGPCTCAPLPASHVMPSPARIPQAECPDRGVEAEIAFQIGTALPPRAAPYTRDEVRAAIASAHPAIELLQSRYHDVTTVDSLSNLADAASQHGFVYGPPIPDWPSIDFAAEGVAVTIDGTEVKRRTGNPAGDMLRLLVWLANEGAAHTGGLQPGQFVTTGSWTGKDTVPEGGTVTMAFDHCGSVEATYV